MTWTLTGRGAAGSVLLSNTSLCPLRARWVSRTRELTVTCGALKIRADLRKGWSDLPATLLPKLIVENEREAAS